MGARVTYPDDVPKHRSTPSERLSDARRPS
jgi:hypothetical protein